MSNNLAKPGVEKVPFVDLLDLTSITRDSKTCYTHIILENPLTHDPEPWIYCGRVNIQKKNDSGVYIVKSYLDYGITDFEHDSALAFSFEVIGLQFNFVDNHQSVFTGFIKPPLSTYDSFNIPAKDFNPLLDATKCDSEYCKKEHLIIEDFLPDNNLKLGSKLGGLKVDIRFGTKHKKG